MLSRNHNSFAFRREESENIGSTAGAEDGDQNDLNILVDPGGNSLSLAWPDSNGSFRRSLAAGRGDDARRLVGRGHRKFGPRDESVPVKGRGRLGRACLRYVDYGERSARHLDGVSRNDFPATKWSRTPRPNKSRPSAKPQGGHVPDEARRRGRAAFLRFGLILSFLRGAPPLPLGFFSSVASFAQHDRLARRLQRCWPSPAR